MKITKDDIQTLNMLRFGAVIDNTPIGKAQWLEVEGFTGIKHMTAGAFLFRHELGECWIPKKAVRFEYSIKSTADVSIYRVYLASWFNWTEKVDMMKKGQTVPYYIQKEKAAAAPYPIVDQLPATSKSKKSSGIDFNRILMEQKDPKLKKFNEQIRLAEKDLTYAEINTVSNKFIMRALQDLIDAIEGKRDAGYDVPSNESKALDTAVNLLDSYQDREKFQKSTRGKKSNKPEDPKDMERAIDL